MEIKKLFKKIKGFTLVELIVVIAIVSILAVVGGLTVIGTDSGGESFSCGSGESITFSEAENNKSKITGSIADYIGCNIIDYPMTGGITKGVIAGITTGNNVMVVSKSNHFETVEWGCDGTDLSLNDITDETTPDWDGSSNTDVIESECTTDGIAADVCRDKGDNWYLPAKSELNVIYQNKNYLGSFDDSYYWSSTEFNSNMAWLQYFRFGAQNIYGKFSYNRVRCASRF